MTGGLTPWPEARAKLLANLMRLLCAPGGKHVYLSTGCLHGEHAYCQQYSGIGGAKVPAECKFCHTPCVCTCHDVTHGEDLHNRGGNRTDG